MQKHLWHYDFSCKWITYMGEKKKSRKEGLSRSFEILCSCLQLLTLVSEKPLGGWIRRWTFKNIWRQYPVEHPRMPSHFLYGFHREPKSQVKCITNTTCQALVKRHYDNEGTIISKGPQFTSAIRYQHKSTPFLYRTAWPEGRHHDILYQGTTSHSFTPYYFRTRGWGEPTVGCRGCETADQAPRK